MEPNSNTTPSPPPPEELRGPFTLEVGLDWFFDKFTRGIHGFATVSRAYGELVAAKDKAEAFIHVDYPEEAPGLAYIYPKTLWIESVKRWDESKRRAEADRQARFIREALAKELQLKFAKREEEIQRFMNIMTARFPSFTNKLSRKQLRVLVISWLQGGGDKGVRAKVGICDETVAEFVALPQPQASEEEELLGLVVEKPSTEVKVS